MKERKEKEDALALKRMTVTVGQYALNTLKSLETPPQETLPSCGIGWQIGLDIRMRLYFMK